MNQSIHKLSAAAAYRLEVPGKYGVATIMTDAVDEASWNFLHRVMSAGVSEGSRVVIMPDCHSGTGCVIGYTQRLNPASLRLCPNILGVDIGCNISSMRLELPEEIERPEKLAEFDACIRAHIGVGLGVYASRPLSRQEKQLIRKDELEAFRDAERLILEDGRTGQAMKRPILAQLKSIGSGNHFIELGRDSHGSYWLTVHSGSREFGRTIALIYQNLAVETCHDRCERELRYLEAGTPAYEHYLAAVRACQLFSQLNHRLILRQLAEVLTGGPGRGAADLIGTMHNYIDMETLTIRKGAVRAAAGERLLIPFNMRDGIAICRGKGNAEWNESAPHGAGRLLSRAEARATLDLAAARAEMAARGIFSTSLDYSLDETAAAYKPMESILERIQPTVEVCDLIRPIYNLKGKG